MYLCSICLNPELKLESLRTNKKEHFKWDETRDYNQVDHLIKNLLNLSMIEDENIHFTKWQKVPVGGSNSNANISKKMVLSLPMPKFTKKLITELKVLKDHLYHVHMQFKAFKNAQEHASTYMNVATLQMDWSENPTLTQAREEKSAYYHNYQIGLHCFHYLLHCIFYSIYRLELLNDICASNHSLKNISEENLLKVLLYGAEEFSFKINSKILNCTIKFIKKTDHFSGPLFLSSFFPPF